MGTSAAGVVKFARRSQEGVPRAGPTLSQQQADNRLPTVAHRTAAPLPGQKGLPVGPEAVHLLQLRPRLPGSPQNSLPEKLCL